MPAPLSEARMRCIIAGSRTAGPGHVIEALSACPFASDITTVVSGTARGADEHGERWAQTKGHAIVRYPADWAKHGKAAGMIRNRQMADNADALIAVWDGESRGTKQMIEEATKRGLRVFVWRTDARTTD